MQIHSHLGEMYHSQSPYQHVFGMKAENLVETHVDTRRIYETEQKVVKIGIQIVEGYNGQDFLELTITVAIISYSRKVYKTT